ncbi:hypothetical protein K438DRAFT_438966 [Mycena galopus ATCC 62051]|nr:hypothetical protein K438DRAFT_438966 [Mycena galopus ATCC 62051]
MIISLSALPADIILEVVSLLELPDPVSLLLTCRSLSSLSRQRIFWISVLEATRNKSPLACPPYTDLSQFTLEALKGLAFSWQKLQENWNLPSPTTMWPVTSTRLSGCAEILANVQGTDILVLYMSESLFCWDAKLEILLPFPPIVDCRSISSFLHTPGVCTVAFLTEHSSQIAHRHVLTVKHEDSKAISFTDEFSELLITDSDFESIFVTEDVVGVIVAMEGSQDSSITVSAIRGDDRLVDSTRTINLHRTLFLDRDLIDCFTYQGHLYVLLDDGLSVQIQHISRQSLRSGCCEETGRYNVVYGRELFTVGFCSMTPSTPFYGISAVFVRLDGDINDTSSFTSFTFLTNTLTHAPSDGVSSPLAFTSPIVTEYVPGTLRDPGLVWLDHSGLNLAAVLQSQSESPRLVLVRYHPKTQSTSTHALIVPSFIDLDELDGVCVDETAGAVRLMDREGLFSNMLYI